MSISCFTKVERRRKRKRKRKRWDIIQPKLSVKKEQKKQKTGLYATQKKLQQKGYLMYAADIEENRLHGSKRRKNKPCGVLHNTTTPPRALVDCYSNFPKFRRDPYAKSHRSMYKPYKRYCKDKRH